MFYFKKAKCEFQTIIRGYKLLYSIDKDLILYKALQRRYCSGFTLHNALFHIAVNQRNSGGKTFGQLMVYAVLIVFINLIMSV